MGDAVDDAMEVRGHITCVSECVRTYMLIWVVGVLCVCCSMCLCMQPSALCVCVRALHYVC